MILTKLPCPDCGGGGIDKRRGGLCCACNGCGKRQVTDAERAVQSQTSIAVPMPTCPCFRHVQGGCDNSCGLD